LTRDEVIAVIIKHVTLNIDGVAAADIDPSKSMKDYDASSLDMVEIVSATMRELRVSVPRTELARLRSINELADVLVAAANRASQIPSTEAV
jgi:acyl carrier protein